MKPIYRKSPRFEHLNRCILNNVYWGKDAALEPYCIALVVFSPIGDMYTRDNNTVIGQIAKDYNKVLKQFKENKGKTISIVYEAEGSDTRLYQFVFVEGNNISFETWK